MYYKQELAKNRSDVNLFFEIIISLTKKAKFDKQLNRKSTKLIQLLEIYDFICIYREKKVPRDGRRHNFRKDGRNHKIRNFN